MYITLNAVRKQSKNQLKLLKIVTFLNIVFLIMMMLSFDAKASCALMDDFVCDHIQGMQRNQQIDDMNFQMRMIQQELHNANRHYQEYTPHNYYPY